MGICPIGPVQIQREILFSETGSHDMEAGKSKICRMCPEAREPGKSQYCKSGLKAICTRIPIPFWAKKVSLLFYLGLYLIEWGLPISWRVMCSTPRPPIQMLISFKSTLTETPGMFNHKSGYQGPTKLTHKIDHSRNKFQKQFCFIQNTVEKCPHA